MTTNTLLKHETQQVFEEMITGSEKIILSDLEELIKQKPNKYKVLKQFIEAKNKEYESKGNLTSNDNINDNSTQNSLYSEILEFLINNYKKDIDINSLNEDGKTILMQIIFNKSLQGVVFLLKYNVDINAKGEDDWTALHQASVLKETEDIVKLLLDKNIEINSLNSKNQNALHLACGKNRNYNARIILLNIISKIEQNSNDKDKIAYYMSIINQKDHLKMTPLLKAFASGSFDTIREFFIIEKKYFSNNNDNNISNSLSSLKLYDANEVDLYDNTILHYAFEYGQEESLSYLIQHDDIKPVKNKDDKYCFELSNNDKIKEKFLKAIQTKFHQ